MTKTLKHLREDAGLSQRRVSQELETALSTVANWDQGRSTPSLSVVLYPKLLRLYGCTPQELADAAIASRTEFEQKQQG